MNDSRRTRVEVLIVDDEQRARRTLRQLLEQEPDVSVAGEASGADAVSAIRDLRPDVVFLDVQMPGRNGFEVLAELEPSEIPIVVFVTAYEEFALKAFEVAAVDYLLKPFSDGRFRTALRRARRMHGKDELSAVRESVERVLEVVGTTGRVPPEDVADTDAALLFRDASRTHVIRPSDIDWIEARGVYVRIHAGSRTLLVRESLKELERRLEPMGFYRIHRSALVRLDRIAELKHRSHGDYQVLLQDGTQLTLTRTRKAGLEARLGDSLR